VAGVSPSPPPLLESEIGLYSSHEPRPNPLLPPDARSLSSSFFDCGLGAIRPSLLLDLLENPNPPEIREGFFRFFFRFATTGIPRFPELGPLLFFPRFPLVSSPPRLHRFSFGPFLKLFPPFGRGVFILPTFPLEGLPFSPLLFFLVSSSLFFESRCLLLAASPSVFSTFLSHPLPPLLQNILLEPPLSLSSRPDSSNGSNSPPYRRRLPSALSDVPLLILDPSPPTTDYEVPPQG